MSYKGTQIDSSMVIYDIDELKILSKQDRGGEGKYTSLTLELSSFTSTREILLIGRINKDIKIIKQTPELLPKKQWKPIDYLEDGCVVSTVNNEMYVYIKALHKFVGARSFFWLHNLDDNLSCGSEDSYKFSYSIKVIYNDTVNTLTYSEYNNTTNSIRWQRITSDN